MGINEVSDSMDVGKFCLKESRQHLLTNSSNVTQDIGNRSLV